MVSVAFVEGCFWNICLRHYEECEAASRASLERRRNIDLIPVVAKGKTGPGRKKPPTLSATLRPTGGIVKGY